MVELNVDFAIQILTNFEDIVPFSPASSVSNEKSDANLIPVTL